jgi:hypothetical protein
MAMTINPAVSGGRHRWLRDVGAFFVGAALGAAAALALILVVVDIASIVIPLDALLGGALVIIAWAILHDLGVPLPLPYRNRQVPDWLREVLPPVAVALVFGAMLGVGFLTLFTYSTHLAVLASLPFLDSATAMLGVVLVFALGKTAVLAGVATVDSLDSVPAYWNPARVRVLRFATAMTSLMLALALLVDR